MEVGVGKGSLLNFVLRKARKYAVVIIFPSLATWAIYADWSRTQLWKKERASKLQLRLDQQKLKN